jgi:hypothetical protein
LNEELIYTAIGEAVVHFLRSNNIINETGLRNFLIKKDYKKLRESLNASDSVSLLCEKYNLSDESIKSILFRK